MLKGKTVTLAIPCKNEEVALASLLKKVPAFVDNVLVIDNNSTDQTRNVAKKMGARLLTEKRHIQGIGYGFAHLRAIKETTTDYLITMDGDNTYPLKALKSLILHAEKNHLNFVSCNRFPLLNGKVLPKVRQLGVFILNTEVKLLYGFPMQDILSGMWLMDRQARKKMQLSCGDWNLSPEIKLAALTHPEIHFGEFHIEHALRAGESKQLIWKTGFEHLFYILSRRFLIDSPLKSFINPKHNSIFPSWSLEN